MNPRRHEGRLTACSRTAEYFLSNPCVHILITMRPHMFVLQEQRGVKRRFLELCASALGIQAHSSLPAFGELSTPRRSWCLRACQALRVAAGGTVPRGDGMAM
jgi:hypothetical protein